MVVIQVAKARQHWPMGRRHHRAAHDIANNLYKIRGFGDKPKVLE